MLGKASTKYNPLTEVGRQVYTRYRIHIPNHIVERDLGWQAGDEVMFDPKSNGRLLLWTRPTQTKPKRRCYAAFSDTVGAILAKSEIGLPWSEIRAKDATLPKTPNALWVRRMEIEKGLLRDPVTRLWKIASSVP